MYDLFKRWVDEFVAFIVASSAALSGWLVIANTYLQTIAFVVSITVGVLSVIAHIEKRKSSNGTKVIEGRDRPKDSERSS